MSQSIAIAPVSLPSEMVLRCPVVNSRVILSVAQTVAGHPDEYQFLACSNLDNCYHRTDFSGTIPECCLHEKRSLK